LRGNGSGHLAWLWIFEGFFTWGFIFQGGGLAGNWEGMWVTDKWRYRLGCLANGGVPRQDLGGEGRGAFEGAFSVDTFSGGLGESG
jgi:hypothetical protein